MRHMKHGVRETILLSNSGTTAASRSPLKPTGRLRVLAAADQLEGVHVTSCEFFHVFAGTTSYQVVTLGEK